VATQKNRMVPRDGPSLEETPKPKESIGRKKGVGLEDENHKSTGGSHGKS